jgi:hypothetical protein
MYNFQQAKGVTSVVPDTRHPRWQTPYKRFAQAEPVCGSNQITYDPSIISYDTLLEFGNTDPNIEFREMTSEHNTDQQFSPKR